MDLGGLLGLSMATGGLSGGLRGPNGAMAMARMTGMTGDMTPVDLATLDRGVKAIVGQHAAPDMAMIRYASMQGGPPSTLRDMLSYLVYMFNIVKNNGIQMPDGTIQHIVPNRPVSSGYPGNRLSTGQGPNVGVTQQKVVELLTKRAREWFMANRFANTAGGFMF